MKIIQAEGQTCNQFWIYSNYIADALHSGERITILAPETSIKDYPNLLHSKVIHFPLFNEVISKYVGYRRYVKFLNKLLANKYSKAVLDKILNVIPGVNYIPAKVSCPKSIYRTYDNVKLKLTFQPSEKIKNDVQSIFSEKRNQYDIIVGVHIRYGDYKDYMGGKYYYSIDQYQSFMQAVKSNFPSKKIAYLVASNENIKLSEFNGLSCFSIPNSSSTHDLHALSLTDYILGPPSTYSAWASYMGNVPLYFIKDPSKQIHLADFINILDVWK